MERVRGCLFLALACLGPSASALAATFTVNAVDERRDAAPGDGSCDADPAAPGEECTLRAAVQEANATPGADTIVVPAGIYRLTLQGSGEDAGLTGDLDLLDTVAILGAGADVSVLVNQPATG